MDMTRRSFIKTMLIAASAPAIVKADNLMKIYVPEKEIIIPKRNIIYVDTKIKSISKTGSDWASAYSSLEEALTNYKGEEYIYISSDKLSWDNVEETTNKFKHSTFIGCEIG
jgi:hypothetical protein